jgi:excisionase family DNA binding protein
MTAVQLLTITQVMDRLGIKARSTIYELISSGELRVTDVAATGKAPRSRVREDDLQKFIEARTRTAPIRAAS